MLKLSCSAPICRDARPIIRPCLVSIRTKTDHRFNGKAHARLCSTHRFVLRIMRNVWRCVEELVYPMAAIGLDDTAISTLGVLFDHISRIAKEHARFDYLDGLVKTFSCSLNDTNRVRVCVCLVANIICFIKITVESFVIEGDVEIEYVTIQQHSLIRYAVADDFVG